MSRKTRRLIPQLVRSTNLVKLAIWSNGFVCTVGSSIQMLLIKLH